MFLKGYIVHHLFSFIGRMQEFLDLLYEVTRAERLGDV
jgi:hypothetical protein